MPQTKKDIIDDRKVFMQSILDCAYKPSEFSRVFLDHKLFDYNVNYVNCDDRFLKNS